MAKKRKDSEGQGKRFYPQSKSYQRAGSPGPGKKTEGRGKGEGTLPKEDRLSLAGERLSLGERLRLWRGQEGEKLSRLSGGERLSYIWEYYKLWIIGIVFGLCFLVFFVQRMFFSVKDYWIYAIFTNTMENVGNGSLMQEDFLRYSGFDPKEKMVEFNAASYFDPSKVNGTNNSYFQSFVAVTEAGDLDLVTLNEEGLKALGASGRLKDLSTQEMEDFWAYEERFVYCIPYNEEYSTQPVPVGIDISDSRLVEEYHLYDADCVLGIGEYSHRLEAVKTFLEWCYEEGE